MEAQETTSLISKVYRNYTRKKSQHLLYKSTISRVVSIDNKLSTYCYTTHRIQISGALACIILLQLS